MLRIFPILFLLLTAPMWAANYTVKNDATGNYTTIQACANVAVAGDTCTVYGTPTLASGNYAGWTQNTNGSAGNLITFRVNTGDTVTLTSIATITGRSYIRITGFNSTATLSSGSQGQVTAHQCGHCQIDHNTFSNIGVNINSGASAGSDNYIGYNTMTMPGNITTHDSAGLNVFGDRNLLEYNTVSGGSGDCFDIGGANVVLRHNTCQNMNGHYDTCTSCEHIDHVQVQGGVNPTLTYSLIEQDVEKSCTNDGGNCHFVIIRALSTQSAADTNIIRYNYAQQLNGTGPISNGGSSTDLVTNNHVYHNTVATESLAASNGSCTSKYAASPTNLSVLNNICYNTTTGSSNWSPPSGDTQNGDIVYTSGYSGGWGAPYNSEATYNSLKNQNPLFANYPTDGTLQSGSPARNVAVGLTTVAAGDSGSGTTLLVNDARFFQPGWAGTSGDKIRIGSNTAQISSIDYSTNTITLVAGISRSVGNSVYLYALSDGTRVLPFTGAAAPDIGAYPYIAIVTCSPSSLTFQTQNVGSSSAPQTVTCTNSGQATATVSGCPWTTGTDFSVSGCPGSIAGGGNANLSVTFTPTATGDRPDTLTISTDGGNSTVSVDGTGGGPPTVTASMTGNFGSIVPGQSFILTVTTANAGIGCTLAIDGGAANSVTCNGTVSESPSTPGTHTYALVASGSTGTAGANVSVLVTRPSAGPF